MNVASLELCKELYELSGWSDTHFAWAVAQSEECRGMTPLLRERIGNSYAWHETPAYDLGYLLRKMLPEYGKVTLTHDFGHSQWWATDVIGHATYNSASPEDAVAKLAIELFKTGVLKKEV